MNHIRAYFQLARPHHYLKNGFLWLSLFFGYKLFEREAIIHTTIGFVVFSLAASSIYILNDLADLAEDRLHPHKKQRPLAGGSVNRTEAGILAGVFFLASFAISYFFYL